MTDPLFPFQEKLVSAAANTDRLFIAADMGLGKTRCAIEAADERGAQRVLVCAPSIGLVSWPSEIEKWSPAMQPLPTNDPDLLPGAKVGRNHIAIVPYSEIERRPRAWVEAARRFDADVTVLDEAHYLKNREAARTQAVYGQRTDLANAIARPGSVVWPMSGTPAPNFTSELWTHLNALAPETIPCPGRNRALSEHEFRQRFSTVRTSMYGVHVTGSVNTPLLRAQTADFFYRIRKADVRSDMPPILWTAEPLPIVARDARNYLPIPDDLDDDTFVGWLKHEYSNSVSSERKATGLAKIAGGVEWARYFLENSDRKLIMFAWHTEVCEALHNELAEFNPGIITGDTPFKHRTAYVNAFQNNDDCRLFIGQMAAAGTSITLTAASDVAFLEDDWTPGTMEQAAARADRLGQTRGVVARILYTPGTKDQRIAQVRSEKAREFNLMFN